MINEIIQGDIREIAKQLETGSVNCIVTSPPYWNLRDYGVVGQIGLEETPMAYVEAMVSIFRELRRVLRDDGTLWLNLGDTYSNEGKNGGHSYGKNYTSAAGGYQTVRNNRPKTGMPAKNLYGIPWRVALALQADGWYLRSDIIWSKPNPMPESVTDRPTKAHEYIFLLAKSERYYYDADVIKENAKNNNGELAHTNCFGKAWDKEPYRNRRSVWDVTTKPYKEAHFAVFPPDLVEPCILAGCPPGGVVLDPFLGSGTTAQVAVETGRNWLGVELNPKYIKLAKKRIAGAQPPLIVPGSHVLPNKVLQPTPQARLLSE